MRSVLYNSRPIDRSGPIGIALRRRWIITNGCFIAFLTLILVGDAPLQEWVMSAQIGQGDLINQALYIGIFATLLLSGAPRFTLRQLLPLPLSLMLLLAYCLVTVSWAIDPMISVRRLILTGLVIWVVFRCVADLGYDRTLLIMRYLLIALLILNFAAVLFSPLGVQPYKLEEPALAGNWRGIMRHKNLAGVVCVGLILLEMFDVRRFPRGISWAAIAGALVFLYFSQSKTSAVVLVFAVASGWLVRPYNANYRGLLVVSLLVAVGFALQLSSVYLPAPTKLLDDPTGLTGRGAIWVYLIDYASDHPWSGAGFGSFWQIGKASPIVGMTRDWVATAPHGHNGYLDLLVTIGVPGLTTAVLVLVVWPLTRLMLSLSISKARRALLFAMLVFCIGHNLSESSMLNGASVVEVFLIMTIALIHRLADRGGNAPRLLPGGELDRSRQSIIGFRPLVETTAGVVAVPRHATLSS